MEKDAGSQEAVARAASSPHTNSGGEAASSASPKKRRKVNHACIYCRRSHMTCDLERPCTRCVKRDIGHLCHDEPREPVRRSKGDRSHSIGDDEVTAKQDEPPNSRGTSSAGQPPAEDQLLQESGVDMIPPGDSRNRKANVQLTQPPQVPNAALGATNQHFTGYNDWSLGGQNQFHDMHTFHPSYMFNAPEVTNEYNLLNDFLSTSLLDDGAMYAGEEAQSLYSEPARKTIMATSMNGSNGPYSAPMQSTSQLLAPPQNSAMQANSISRPPSAIPIDKARETYYMTAADPSGSDAPETRIGKLLQAKYDAGMLRPFNYVNGYARLNKYMEKHMQPSSRQKILRQLEKFRPKFREAMQSLTDVQLVLVEMWFEKCLMEYDRVFASMAVPACCWRRTGEIFRGNREMAELIHVPIEKLRDGKLAIHEIIVEDHLVSYWEKFGAIAFDNSQKAMLTSCSLKNPDLHSRDPEISCCFSFTIRRDEHNIPSLIVGNFLPVVPKKS